MEGNVGCSEHCLSKFIIESNKIEGIQGMGLSDQAAHERLLALETLTVEDVCQLVLTIEPRGLLRTSEGMDVYIGGHTPPAGGKSINPALASIIRIAVSGTQSVWQIHKHYESLHPFIDGNGRSGRALALWQAKKHNSYLYEQFIQLGFLHTWYYLSLDERRQ